MLNSSACRTCAGMWTDLILCVAAYPCPLLIGSFSPRVCCGRRSGNVPCKVSYRHVLHLARCRGCRHDQSHHQIVLSSCSPNNTNNTNQKSPGTRLYMNLTGYTEKEEAGVQKEKHTIYQLPAMSVSRKTLCRMLRCCCLSLQP